MILKYSILILFTFIFNLDANPALTYLDENDEYGSESSSKITGFLNLLIYAGVIAYVLYRYFRKKYLTFKVGTFCIKNNLDIEKIKKLVELQEMIKGKE